MREDYPNNNLNRPEEGAKTSAYKMYFRVWKLKSMTISIESDKQNDKVFQQEGRCEGYDRVKQRGLQIREVQAAGRQHG